ncbi:MAG: DNA mismatch endonuclease Vsr [Anaerolineae bacterium]|nr:DNA mismatch endonuclease Vsr [Anaerolineae bacterium]
MTDRITKAQRSRNMARVKNKNTAPELIVRKALHRLGFRFRLHRSDLPGNPDIVLPRHHKAIFVHGCFWHGHDCPRGKRPSTRQKFWNRKLDGNQTRDRTNQEKLKELGWQILIVWECQVKCMDKLEKCLLDFMNDI